MAYGSIAAPLSLAPLPILSYALPTPPTTSLNASQHPHLLTFPVTRESMPTDLGEWLLSIFNDELASGKTYPQEAPMTLDEFLNYFFGATTILGILTGGESTTGDKKSVGKGEVVTDAKITLDTVRGGRSWDVCFGGCFYIKPNYPGRSSHNCNAGFIIPPSQRGQKIGIALGESYLIYAPLLGYRASVFNLVYKNNVASLAIWDKLGFSRVGLIPQAGRLKTGPNGEEEYVDAVVVWKSFVEEENDRAS